MVATDTTTDDYTDGNPLLLLATKAGPCVHSLARAAPGGVLGRGGPGWAGVGRRKRRSVVADGGLHGLRRRLRGVGVGGGRGVMLNVPFSRERKKLFECGFDARAADSTGCARVKTALKQLFPFLRKRDIRQK